MQRVDTKIKLHFVENFTEGDKDEQLEAMKNYFDFVPPEEAEAIYCASIIMSERAEQLSAIYKKPLVTYCWDYYLWAHEGRSPGYNWPFYAGVLKKSDVVFVPSSGQQKRLKELLDVQSIVVHTGILTYDHDTKNGGYVLDPVRDYPEENLGWVKRACEELNIPYVHTEHGYSKEEFRKLVSECSFMTCGYREASTGGLTLMEGLFNGKRSLVSNSPYMGASDYLRELGAYFQYDNYEDLKEKILEMWGGKDFDRTIARTHVEKYSFDEMARGLYNGIKNACEQRKSS